MREREVWMRERVEKLRERKCRWYSDRRSSYFFCAGFENPARRCAALEFENPAPRNVGAIDPEERSRVSGKPFSPLAVLP
jgi:hypothetical protein